MVDPQPGEWPAPGFCSEFEDLLSLYPNGFCSNAIHKNGFGRMGMDLNLCFGEQYIRGNHDGEAKRDVRKNQVTFEENHPHYVVFY
ncbi:hypothetical protein OIU84_011828 [Salix udensis]|uniref:Uncharacterized protein n=1 Tax=Salix udensis TaxID=889485 RepID=A0AAD6JNR5_9ROSI|nr:hypothetical protein OIU84_011828 [Salix udensis]